MTLSIELDAPTLTALRIEAEALGLPVEEHAARKLSTASPSGIPASDEAFRKAMEATFKQYDAAYRRLAQ